MKNPICYLESRIFVQRLRRHPIREALRTFGILGIWLVPNLAWVTLGSPGRPAEVAYAVFFLQILYFTGRSLVSGAAAMTRERDLRLLEVLMSTPVSIVRVMRGKYAAVVLPLLVEALIAVPLSCEILLCPPQPVPPGAISALFILSCSTILCFAALGMLVATRARNTVQGITTSLFIGLLWIGLSWYADLLSWSNGQPYLPRWCVLNPMAGVYSLLGLPDSEYYTSIEWTELWMLTCMIYLVLAAVFASLATRRAERAAA